jgi:putative PIN family toxin of toxin-antitoxin system
LFDTNVLVSALAEGTRLSVLRHAWKQGLFVLVYSDETLAELLRAMSYPKLGWDKSLAKEVVATEVLPWAARVVPQQGPLPAPCRDKDDEPMLRAALAAEVEALVTGDKDLLCLNGKYPFPILTPRHFVDRLGMLDSTR